MNVAGWLLAHLQAKPAAGDARPAITDDVSSISREGLTDQVQRTSAVLASLGVVPGDRVGLMMRDTHATVATLLGIWHAGAVAVPISELARPHDATADLQGAGAVAIFVDVATEQTVEQIRAQLPKLKHVLSLGRTGVDDEQLTALLAGVKPRPHAHESAPDALCLLIYGRHDDPDQRAVAHSHQSIISGCELARRGPLAPLASDTVLSTFRLCTAVGQWAGMLVPLSVGAHLRLITEQAKSDTIRQLVQRDAPTVIWSTPSLFSQLVRDASANGWEAFLAGVRLAVATGEAMPDRLASAVQAQLGTPLLVSFSISEMFHPLLIADAACDRDQAGVSGKPAEGVKTQIVNELDRPVGTNEIGTLEVQSMSMAPGYWRQHKLHAVSGTQWLTTTDRCFRDDLGNYHYCGRVDDWFKVGGKWVAPFEIERVLGAHDAVWECAVIGSTGDDGLLKPLAFVVLNVGFAASEDLSEQLRQHVKHHLAPYKYPRWIEYVEALPRGATGKLLRYKLKSTKRRRVETLTPL